MKTDTLLVAVGDIHGSYEALLFLIEKIEIALEIKKYRLIFLGDYIDRGSAGRSVLDYLILLRKNKPDSIFIRGNHEQLILDGSPWGVDYNQSVVQEYETGEVNQEHLQFIKEMPLYFEYENFVFMHGGIPKGYKDVRSVPASDLMWTYGTHSTYVGKKIVSGHWAQSTPQINHNSILIDTGCCYPHMGHLTAAVLNDNTGNLMQLISVPNPIHRVG